MDRARIEKFVGLLVRVDLVSGQNLAGTLGVPTFSPRQFEVVQDKKHTLFWAEDVADIMRLHPAEEAEIDLLCTCTGDGEMSWTTCPRHSFEGQ